MNKYKRTPDSVIDLHGHTISEAREVLERLVAEQRYLHVRVVTGKGDLRNGPVLRRSVEEFFKRRGIRFHYAKMYEGGEGALEVFFK